MPSIQNQHITPTALQNLPFLHFPYFLVLNRSFTDSNKGLCRIERCRCAKSKQRWRLFSEKINGMRREKMESKDMFFIRPGVIEEQSPF